MHAAVPAVVPAFLADNLGFCLFLLIAGAGIWHMLKSMRRRRYLRRWRR